MHFASGIETPMFEAPEAAGWPIKIAKVDQSLSVERIRVRFNSIGSIMALQLLDRDD